MSQGVKRKIASHIFAKAIEDLNSDEANDSDIPTYIRNKYGPLLLDVYARSKFKEQAYDQVILLINMLIILLTDQLDYVPN